MDIKPQEDFFDNLKVNARRLAGNWASNNIRMIRLGQQSLKDPNNTAAVADHVEDPTVDLNTPGQLAIRKQEEDLRTELAKRSAERAHLQGKSVKPGDPNYLHREGAGVGSTVDKYVNGTGKTLSESQMRKSVGSDITPDNYTADTTGDAGKQTLHGGQRETGVATVPRPPEETGIGPRETGVSTLGPKKIPSDTIGTYKVLSHDHQVVDIHRGPQEIVGQPRQVTGWTNGVKTKMGKFRLTSNDALLQKDLKPVQNQIDKLTAEEKTLSGSKSRLKSSPGRLRNISYKLADLAKQKADIISEHENNLVGKKFVDNTGQRWTITRGTMKEIEQHNPNVHYYHNAIMTTAKALVDIVHSINVTKFIDSIKNHSEADSHMLKEGDTRLLDGKHEDWVTPKSDYFRSYKVDPEMNRFINQHLISQDMGRNWGERIWQAANSAATQFIVMNPGIHGLNLLQQLIIQTGNAPLFDRAGWLGKVHGGPLNLFKALQAARDMADPEARMSMLHDYLQHGGHVPSYGKNMDTAVTGALKGLPGGSPTKWNAKSMSNIDMNVRTIAYATDRAGGMDPDKAVAQIDTAMGREENASQAARDVGMFWHWTKTQGNQIFNQVAHPLANAGANINTAVSIIALQLGLNKMIQDVTGNKNANFTARGELGMLDKGYKVAKDLATKNWSGAQQTGTDFALSHITPALHTGIDAFSGKNVETGQQNSSVSSKINQAKNDMFAPGSYISKVTGGKQTLAQTLASEYGGINTPNAKGAPAAPNFEGKSILNSFNVPKSVNAAPEKGMGGKMITDPTGYQQVQNYYNDLQKNITNDNSLSPTDKNAITSFLTKDKTPTGQSIFNSPGQTENYWRGLAANPNSLPALQKFYQQDGNHNPEWDLSGNGTINGKSVSKLELWAVYKSLSPGDLQKDEITASNPWISTTETNVQNWINKLPPSQMVQNKGYVPYPNIPTSAQTMMNTITRLANIPAQNRTTAQINQLSKLENNQGVKQAYNNIDNYNNKVLAGMNKPKINYPPNASPQVANFTNKYMAASKAGRQSMIANYPTLYSQMENSLAQQSLGTAEKDLGQSYYGAPVSSGALSSIYSLGQYDIAKGTNPNGTSGYSINPAAAYAQSGTSSGYSSSGIIKPPVIGMASWNKLISEAKSSKGLKSPKIASKASKSYHVKRLSLGKVEKIPKQLAPKKPSSVSSNGIAKYTF